MSCLLHDIHSTAIHQKLAAQRVTGMEEDEVLYIDDVLCVTQTEEDMSRLLEAIEIEGGRYGLELNEGKCEYLPYGNTGPVFFRNGTPVQKKESNIYDAI